MLTLHKIAAVYVCACMRAAFVVMYTKLMWESFKQDVRYLWSVR